MLSALAINVAVSFIFVGALILRSLWRDVENQDERRDVGARRVPGRSRYRRY